MSLVEEVVPIDVPLEVVEKNIEGNNGRKENSDKVKEGVEECQDQPEMMAQLLLGLRNQPLLFENAQSSSNVKPDLNNNTKKEEIVEEGPAKIISPAAENEEFQNRVEEKGEEKKEQDSLETSIDEQKMESPPSPPSPFLPPSSEVSVLDTAQASISRPDQAPSPPPILESPSPQAAVPAPRPQSPCRFAAPAPLPQQPCQPVVRTPSVPKKAAVPPPLVLNSSQPAAVYITSSTSSSDSSRDSVSSPLGPLSPRTAAQATVPPPRPEPTRLEPFHKLVEPPKSCALTLQDLDDEVFEEDVRDSPEPPKEANKAYWQSLEDDLSGDFHNLPRDIDVKGDTRSRAASNSIKGAVSRDSSPFSGAHVDIDVRGIKYRVPSMIRCHLCLDSMRLCLRRTRYRGERREYPAYRCNRKGCQTFRSIRKVFDNPDGMRIQEIFMYDNKEAAGVIPIPMPAPYRNSVSLPGRFRVSQRKRAENFNEFQEQLKQDIIANKKSLEESRRANNVTAALPMSNEQGTLLYIPKVLTPRQIVDIQEAVVQLLIQRSPMKQVSLNELPVFSNCPLPVNKLQGMLRNPQALDCFGKAMLDSPQPPLPIGYEIDQNGNVPELLRSYSPTSPTTSQFDEKLPRKRSFEEMSKLDVNTSTSSVLRDILSRPSKVQKMATRTISLGGYPRRPNSQLADAYMRKKQRDKEREMAAAQRNFVPPPSKIVAAMDARQRTVQNTYSQLLSPPPCGPPTQQFFHTQPHLQGIPSPTLMSSFAFPCNPASFNFFAAAAPPPMHFKSTAAPAPPQQQQQRCQSTAPNTITLQQALNSQYVTERQRSTDFAFIPTFYQQPMLSDQLFMQPFMPTNIRNAQFMDQSDITCSTTISDSSCTIVQEDEPIVDQGLKFDPPVLDVDDEKAEKTDI
ncbi:unnamed protein product [Caenorhabditis auriculariae]|uniref:Uncharacterized protein n=1 Tax=Caenorhabditis auriculariae TaxID=2777116 RepID=A0A8S1H455_9PELO|nr:unnamed protein product [Caenorhabditis auriculariae]